MHEVQSRSRESRQTKLRPLLSLGVAVLACSLLAGFRNTAGWRAYLAGFVLTAPDSLYRAHQGLERSYSPVEISVRPASQSPTAGPGAAPSPAQGADAVVAVNDSVHFQAVEGFGATHVTLARGPNKDALSPALRAQAIEAVYGQVRLTTGNVEAGVIEAPSDATDPRAQQANDDGDPFHFNWHGFNFAGSDAAKQMLIDLAQPKGFDNYYLGPKINVHWANKWMKAIRATDYNRYLDEAAEQVAAGMIHWRDSYGIVTKYIQLFNEPTSGNHELGPGSTQEVIDIIKRTGERLKREGFPSVKFVVPGEETEERSLEVASTILADPDARQYVGAISYHSYPYGSTYSVISKILRTSGRGTPDPERVAVRRSLRDLGSKYALPVWMTEVSHGDVPALSFDGLLGRAIHIHDEFVYANAAEYFGMTNLTDSLPVHDRAHNPFSEEGEIAIADLSAGKIYITGMGFAIGHYARWLPRGAVRIDATSSDPLLLVTAFRVDAQNRLVLVLINNEDHSSEVKLQLNGFSLKMPVRFTGEQSTARGAWAPIIPLLYDSSADIKFVAAARSVTTIAANL